MISDLVFPMDEHIVGTQDFRNIRYGADIIGYQLKIRLSYYRSLPLSCIEQVTLSIDGTEVPASSIVFIVNDKLFALDQLRDLYAEWWNIVEDATLEVDLPGGLPAGSHEVEVSLVCRTPYLFFNGDYVRRRSRNNKTLTLAQ